jgi:hypothetical protein
MNRQLFIHHYLPSHLASALVAGAVLHFLLSETIEYPISVRGHSTRLRPRQWAELGTRGPVIVVISFIALFAAFVYIAPITYGTPGYAFVYFAPSWEADTLQFADWMAMRSTLSDCYHPGHFTLLPSHSSSRDRSQGKKLVRWRGGEGRAFDDYCPNYYLSDCTMASCHRFWFYMCM